MTTDFQVPRISSEKVDDRRGSFTIEPLDKGFGYTFGNSLRRVLLSSLGGAAITSVRIEGVAHEFSTVPGVKEDVTDIVRNLKELVVRMHTDADEVEAPLVATGPGEVKAKDIDLPSGVEILNPNAQIATLEKKTKLEVYLTIGRGRGYSPADENKSEEQPIGVIPIDSIFSPIRRGSHALGGHRRRPQQRRRRRQQRPRRDPDRGAGAGRAFLQLPEAGGGADGRRPGEEVARRAERDPQLWAEVDRGSDRNAAFPRPGASAGIGRRGPGERRCATARSATS